jgi:LPXTG-motif cell wall-anchored protein
VATAITASGSGGISSDSSVTESGTETVPKTGFNVNTFMKGILGLTVGAGILLFTKYKKRFVI